MKKFFKKVLLKAKEWWIWLTSKRVGEMLYDEKITYEDVIRAIKQEL